MTQVRTDLPEPLYPAKVTPASISGATHSAQRAAGSFPNPQACPDPGESSLSREGSTLPSWGPGQSELQQEGSRLDLHLQLEAPESPGLGGEGGESG